MFDLRMERKFVINTDMFVSFVWKKKSVRNTDVFVSLLFCLERKTCQEYRYVYLFPWDGKKSL